MEQATALTPRRMARFFALAVATLFAFALAVGMMGAPAQAAEPEASEAELAELADFLEFVQEGDFTKADGSYNYEATSARYGSEFADDVQAEFDKAEARSGVATQAKSDSSYASCLLKGIGLGGLVGASAAIVDNLKDKQWSDAARLIGKEAVKRGIKIGIKGGAAGIAAALGAYAIWCATPWG